MENAPTLRVLPAPIPFGLTVLVFAVAILLSFSSIVQTFPELAIGITYDLAVTAPFFYYLAIRKTGIPKFTVVAVFGLGLLTAAYLLPENSQYHVGMLATFVLPAVELTIAGFIGYKAFKGIRAYRQNRDQSDDLRIVLRKVTDEVLGIGLLSKAAAFEMSIFAYAFWPVRKLESAGKAFTYHKQRGTTALYGIIVFVIAAEAVVLHLIIIRWSLIAAWLLTISSLYLIIILVAQFRAIHKRPIEVLEDSVIIRCGLFCETEIPIGNIKSVESTNILIDSDTKTCQAALLKGLEGINLIINLKENAIASGPYWIKQDFERIALFVDQKEEFIKLISQYDND